MPKKQALRRNPGYFRNLFALLPARAGAFKPWPTLSLGSAALFCAAPLSPLNMWLFVPAAGYAGCGLWSAWQSCRDTILELRSLSRFSGRLY